MKCIDCPAYQGGNHAGACHLAPLHPTKKNTLIVEADKECILTDAAPTKFIIAKWEAIVSLNKRAVRVVELARRAMMLWRVRKTAGTASGLQARMEHLDQALIDYDLKINPKEAEE